jgi:hypothetical protein
VKWKVNSAISKLTAISCLSCSQVIPAPKHVAFKLLATSGVKLLSYVATVVPPQFTVSHFTKFDKVVKKVFFRLLYPDIVVSTERVERAYLRATLPVGKGGLGLLKTSLSAAPLWVTMVRNLVEDNTIQPFIYGLKHCVPEALVTIRDSVGGEESQAWKDLTPHFIIERVGDSPEPPPRTMLRDFLIAIRDVQILKVNDMFAPDKVCVGGSLTKSDVISFNSRSNLNLVFNSRRIKNLSNDHFVKLTTTFLGLPPTQDRANAKVVPGFDYCVESCLSAHGKHSSPFLDANADHHSGSCPSAALSVNWRHNNLTSAIIMFASEAGAVTTREPPTHNFFEGSLSKEQCKRIFPKRATSVYKKKSTEIMNLLTQASVDQAKLDSLCSTLPVLDPKDSVGLRVDVAIRNPNNDKVFLLDGAFIHTSCAAYRDPEFICVSDRIQTSDDTIKKNANDPMNWEQSTAIVAKAKSKVDKYTPLMQVIQLFERQGKLQRTHNFVPFIMSSRGELSREAFCLVEEIVAMYKFKVTNCEALAFPLPLNRAVSDFRSRFKLALMRVAAVGLAAVACNGGRHFDNRSVDVLY